MKLDNNKLTEVLVTSGIPEESAIEIATSLYENEEKVMFRAILWAYAKFGDRATYDVELIKRVMLDGSLNEFQAQAKIIHQEITMDTFDEQEKRPQNKK